MKALFHLVYMETPHFETELELMAKHLDAGDDVYVLACNGELGTCFANKLHETSACERCQARRTTGLRLLGNRVTLVPYPFQRAAEYPAVSGAFETFEALTDFRLDNVQLGLAAASSLSTHLNDHRFDVIAHRDEVAAELNTAFFVYQAVKQVLLDLRPDRVYLFNGRFSTVLPALNACEELGVSYATHDRGGTMYRYRLVEDGTVHDLARSRREMDLLWRAFPEAESARRGAQFFTGRRSRLEQSWYSYTKAQTIGCLPEGFDRAKRNIAIFNSGLDEVAAIRSRPSNFVVYLDERDALGRICASLSRDPAIHVYLRVHPRLHGRDNAQVRDLRALEGRHNNLTIIPPESTVDSYALMEHCACVVTFGSTMGAEACFWGKPSLLLGRAYYEDLDCTYKPQVHEEVLALLVSDLEPGCRDDALKYGLWELECGTPFTRYEPESFTRGTFDGVRIADPG